VVVLNGDSGQARSVGHDNDSNGIRRYGVFYPNNYGPSSDNRRFYRPVSYSNRASPPSSANSPYSPNSPDSSLPSSSSTSSNRLDVSPLPEALPRIGAVKFAEILTRAGLTSALSGERRHTIFAPTDAAMERFLEQQPAAVREKLFSDDGDDDEASKETLKALLLNHVAAGSFLSTDITSGTKV
jgi:hypothetical protein